MSLLLSLLACSEGDFETNLSGTWSGEFAVESGYYGTRPFAFVDLAYHGPVPNYSLQEGTWHEWTGMCAFDGSTPAPYALTLWQCEDEDACTTPGYDVLTGEFFAICWAGQRALGSYPQAKIIGSFVGDEAEGTGMYGGFGVGQEQFMTEGTVALRRE